MGLFYTYLGAIDLGLIWGFLVLGVYITFRLLNIADMTVDGSFATGGAVCAVCVLNGIHPLLAILIAMLAGALAGFVTGMLLTKCQIPAILAGILTQLGLYSINLRIMGSRANIPLTSAGNTLFATLAKQLGISRYYVTFGIAGSITLLVIVLLYWFFGTETGSAFRATGNNEQMARSLGINTDMMKLLGLMLANSLVALSGSLNTLYGQASDVRAGTGAIVIALASIVIGEVIFRFKNSNFAVTLFSVVVGSMIYRCIVSLVLQFGLNTDDLKLLTAIIVAVALTVPTVLAKRQQLATYKKLTGKEDK